MEAKRSNGNENLEDEHFFRWTFFVEHRSENGDVGNLKKKKRKESSITRHSFISSFTNEAKVKKWINLEK